jgi:protein-tyrosine phosphatase
MNRVWERLYLGDWDDAEKLAKSNPNHITTVVTVCEDAVISRARRVNYLHFAIADSRAIPVAKLDAILDAIGENIRWGKVLINCGAGMSRAPIVTAAWMDACGYKNVEAALEELAELRPIIDPSPTLLKSVKEHLR